MYWQIVIHRVSDMSLFDSRHDTQCHAVEVVMSRHVKTHHQITLYHHIISHHMTLQNRKRCHRTERNRISYHIISYLSNTDTRWYCNCYRYSDSDIIDLSARDTSRHHITSHQMLLLHWITVTVTVTVQLQYSTRQDKTRQYSTITGQSRATLLSTVRYYHRIDDTSWLVLLRVISVELTSNTHRHYYYCYYCYCYCYYYFFHFYYCHYHRVVTIADRYSHSVWSGCVLSKVWFHGDVAYICFGFYVGTSV